MPAGVKAQTQEVDADTLPRKYFQNFYLLNGEQIYEDRYDTSLTAMQVVGPVYKSSFANMHTGNFGGAVWTGYFDYNPLPKKLNYGVHAYETYEFGIAPGMYENKKVFTNLFYLLGSRKEQYFKVAHKQQFGKRLMAGLDLAAGATQGFYARQVTNLRNFDIFGMYETKNNRYRLYTKFIYNKVDNEENGGLLVDSLLVEVNAPDARTLPVRLNDAERIQKEKAVYFQQQYFIIKPKREVADSTLENNKPGVSLDLRHAFLFNDRGMIFQTASIDTDYFAGTPIFDTVATFDSTHERSYLNDLQMNLTFKNIGEWDNMLHADFYFGGTHQNMKINQRSLDTLFGDFSLYGGVRVSFVDALSVMLRYDQTVDGTIMGAKKLETGFRYLAFNDILRLDFTYAHEKRTPELYSLLNVSNHFLWYNQFSNTKVNRFSFDFEAPWWDVLVSMNFQQLSDYVYYDESAYPDQYSGKINILSLYFTNRFNYHKFHMINKILYQQTNEPQLIRIPKYSIHESFFYERNFFKNALRTQLGFDFSYNTSFYSPYYMPATGQFMLQDEARYGSYFFADAFLNFRVKTARFFFRLDHLNAGWSKKQYILLAHYPMQRRMIRFGVSWNLFD